MGTPKNPPRDGEGDSSAEPNGGGGPAILSSPIKQIKRARRLRQDMSLPEVILWQALRKRPGDLKFRRQFPQAGYILDFACLEARLAIEVDSEAHERGDRPARDARRDAVLSEAGFGTLRITATDVLRDLEAVVSHIVATCRAQGPLHRQPAAGGPPPRAGEDLSRSDHPRDAGGPIPRTDGDNPSDGSRSGK